MALIKKFQRSSVHKMQRMQFFRSNLSLLLVWPLAGLLLVGTLWGVTFSKLNTEKSALQEHALQEASALAEAHAKQATQAMEKLDELTMQIKYDWQHSKGSLRLPGLIELGIFAPSRLAIAAVIGKNGLIQTVSVRGNASRSFKQSAYFQFHRDNNSSAIYVGKPVIGWFSHRLVVQVSRRLENSRGDFDGVVIISVTPDYFAPFSVGKDRLLALIGKDGVVRMSAVNGAPGENSVMNIHPELTARAQTPQLLDKTWFADKQARFVAAAPLKKYPFTAIVGLAENQVMAPYAENRKIFIRLDTIGSLVIGFFVLVSMLLSARLALRKAHAEEIQRAYRVATEGGNEGFYMWQALRDRTGKIRDFKVVDCNERGAELYGMKKAQLMGKSYSHLYHGAYLERVVSDCRQGFENGYLEADYQVPELSALRALWVHRKMVRTREGLAVTMRDISQLKAHEQEMTRMATEDALTGLPNRYWLTLNLPGILARARKNDSMLAVLFIDLDDFKNVNDSLGHSAGDELLKAAAQRLRSLIRPADSIARLGGDEFTIILDPIANPDIDAAMIRIINAFKAPFELSQGKHFVGTSIGISIYPRDGIDAETLLKNADIAMYSAKTKKGNFCFYTTQLYERRQARLTTEKDLIRALENDEFVMHYQPRVSTLTGKIVGLEALVRWNHPTRGEVQPGQFIPIAESTDIILHLGATVVNKVCAQLRDWQNGRVPLVPVSINVSAKQFDRSDVKGLINDCLRRYGIPAEWLEIELTESMMMSESEEILAELKAIKALGVRIHVDDFGTGYSSLALLQRLNVDVLKIDRTFTSKLGISNEGAIFFRAIVSMAHALGMDIVAEGVETIEQLRVLLELGCNEVQGFYISKALPSGEITPLLAKSHLFSVAAAPGAQDGLAWSLKGTVAAEADADHAEYDFYRDLRNPAGDMVVLERSPLNQTHLRREAELDISLTRFEMSREMLNDGIWDLAVINGNPFNPNNEFWWSPQFRRLLGFETEAEFPNVLSSWTSRLHPDDEASVMLAFISHLSDKSGKTPYDIEYRLRDKNDAYHYFHARGQTKRAHDGTPLRAIGALTNIDDLKNLLAAEKAKAEYQSMLASSLRDIREEERVALAREVHDQLGQVLSAAKIDIKLLEDDMRPADAPLSRRKIARELRSARQSIDKAIQSVREISANLRSPELDDHGLFAAITWHVQDFERRARIKCTISIADAVGEPEGLIAVALFRIFQEATTNILRHANASQAWVSLDRRGEAIRLRVRDNGVGIGPAAARSSHSTGLKGMRERVALVKGRLTVAPLQPQGTLVSVRIPVTADCSLFNSLGPHDHDTCRPQPRRQKAD